MIVLFGNHNILTILIKKIYKKKRLKMIVFFMNILTIVINKICKEKRLKIIVFFRNLNMLTINMIKKQILNNNL